MARPKDNPPHSGTIHLGWFLRDVHGYKEVSHTGGLPGQITQVTLLPELHLGIIVLTNQETLAITAITNHIEDHYLGLTGQDRIQEIVDQMKARQAGADQATAAVWQQVAVAQKAAARQKPNPAAYLGRYHDAWLGDMTIVAQGTLLWLKTKHSPRLTGQLLPYRGSTYVVRWRDRSFNADAFAAFTLDEQGRASGFKMKPISPATDFSYDFQDLDLKHVE